MTVHTFGTPGSPAVVLIHPSLVRWDYFQDVIPLMQDRYRLLVPALPGYDQDAPGDFTSVEQIASELADALEAEGIREAACLYGCSMGGAVVARFLADGRIRAHAAVMDGGITPYQLPWIATRVIAVKDFMTIALGKLGGPGLLEKAFSTDEYAAEELQYVADVLASISWKTIWRTFDSSNNYRMPADFRYTGGCVEYWYADAEKKARKWDIDYIAEHFPRAVFREFKNIGHGGLAVLKPALLVSQLERVMAEG